MCIFSDTVKFFKTYIQHLYASFPKKGISGERTNLSSLFICKSMTERITIYLKSNNTSRYYWRNVSSLLWDSTGTEEKDLYFYRDFFLAAIHKCINIKSSFFKLRRKFHIMQRL